ncbi:MAG TPA: HDIG domain-containing protein [Nitrososphaerales archaeon]|nr:HDIG domain-containing protein [Nitrososphaerales archaeon]
MIPSEEEALALHRKYGSNETMVRHCVVVAKVAKVLADGFLEDGKSVDASAVAAGALLHDIGRNRTQAVRHGLEGATILGGEGVDETVVQIVRRHVGAGISREEGAELGLPALDYIPRTLEERIVCFADKLVDSDKVRPFAGEVERFARKGHDVDRLLALKKGLQDELGEDPERLVLDNLKESE